VGVDDVTTTIRQLVEWGLVAALAATAIVQRAFRTLAASR
jgi:hypothetical protein